MDREPVQRLARSQPAESPLKKFGVQYIEFNHLDGQFLVDVFKHEVIGRVVQRFNTPRLKNPRDIPRSPLVAAAGGI